ncbi:MAG: imidazoleglycerol-phosphate dehydratase HisB [Oscillospiraceae bacterium]|jgi:imidazoleglycerol-phosphate dehydratase|nr:imidazoleglycerol-phosphate dehydratase HisB [Oscillospiraceae bacterium]
MRYAEINRSTSETEIKLSFSADGVGDAEIDSGAGFLDHMLTLFAHHGRFDITLRCRGDVETDLHHTVEDTGICLGDAFAKALGDRRGITRYADITLPMDEALVTAAVDISGRGVLVYDLGTLAEKVGVFDTETAREFWSAFCRRSGATLHLRRITGENTHHILEASFKAAARALRRAIEIDEQFADEVPSSKGLLE